MSEIKTIQENIESKCNYRNCNNIIDGIQSKKGKKYCCRKHKDMEKTYLKRKKALLKKYFENESKLVEMYKFFNGLK